MTSGERLEQPEENESQKQTTESPVSEDQSTPAEEVTSQEQQQLPQIYQQKLQFHQGPLPPPEVLQGYGDIDASFPKRIMQLAEREQEHRHENERKMVDAEAGSVWRGQCGAIGLGLAALIAAVPIAIWGNAAVPRRI